MRLVPRRKLSSRLAVYDFFDLLGHDIFSPRTGLRSKSAAKNRKLKYTFAYKQFGQPVILSAILLTFVIEVLKSKPWGIMSK